MDNKDKEIWDKIFNNDPDGILDIKLKKSNTRTADERLVSSFQEINDFFIKQTITNHQKSITT